MYACTNSLKSCNLVLNLSETDTVRVNSPDNYLNYPQASRESDLTPKVKINNPYSGYCQDNLLFLLHFFACSMLSKHPSQSLIGLGRPGRGWIKLAVSFVNTIAFTGGPTLKISRALKVKDNRPRMYLLLPGVV